MKFTLDAAYSTWNRRFGKGRSWLLCLPEDILVDEIFPRLSIRDIIRLRQVCKSLNFLTKTPAVWKRLLPHMKHSRRTLAPLPPTKMYNLSNLSGYEMETLVTRAISYDRTWKSSVIKYQYTFGACARQHVEEMVLLPGAHFLVMSVKTYDGQYGLAIWSLQHRASGKPAPLFFRRTEVKAYGLTAKYMVLDGSKSLVVAFLRKRHKEHGDPRYIPETFELGGKEDQEDPYMPLKYECTVLHISLRILDYFNERNAEPMTEEFNRRIRQVQTACIESESGIWLPLARIRMGSQLGVVSLDVIDDEPYVCVVKRPDQIVLQRLGLYESERSTLVCRSIPEYGPTSCFQHHSIWNFRVLPEQGRILVVRNVTRNPDVGMESDHLVLEMYPIPGKGKVLESDGTSRSHLTSRAYTNVQISEVQRTLSPHDDNSITPIFRQYYKPPPLSLFLRTNGGMVHHSLWPIEKRTATPGRNARTIFIYDLARSSHVVFGDPVDDEEDVDQTEDAMDGFKKRPPRRRKDDVLRFLPGAQRAFVYAIPRDHLSTEPPITECWGFEFNERDYMYLLDTPPLEATELDAALAEMEEDPEPPQGEEISDGFDSDFDEPPTQKIDRETTLGLIDLPEEELQPKLLLGVSGICFDEDSGRVVIATKVDDRIQVVDFARSRSYDSDDAFHEQNMVEPDGREPKK